MFILKKVYLGIILSVIVLVICEDEKAAEEEEKDPWDTSTDKYRHHLGSSKSSDTEEPVKIDVTEVSESEVHSSRSKLCKNCKTRAVVREAPKISNVTKLHNTSLVSRNIRKEVDEETKEQIKDAIDERDPADSETKDTKAQTKHHGGSKKHGLSKKQLNNKIDFYPGSLWEYPYPYYHPQYGCGGKKGPCTPEAKPVEAKEDKKKEKVSGSVFPKIKGFGWIWKGPRVSEIGTSWGTPCWFNQEKKQFTCRQLIPSHYYGPPSAGWGGFQPGHTGGGWGTPYWYKKCAVPHKHCKQIIPSHYYGPPSAGWGGFQPGQTGGGWGTPYWYKKCAVPQKDCRQIIPAHYYGPPSAGWGGFQPGHTGGGWGTPYWYRRCLIPQKQCGKQLIPSHYYGPPSAGWGGFQPGQTGGGWGTPHWSKRCETPQLNCRGYIPSPYQSNWLSPGSSSFRSSDPWSQSLYGSPATNDQASRKWNVNDDQGIGHIEKENGGWDSGYGAGHGLSNWGEANQYGAFPEAMHEECNKINEGIKQGYCDDSVGSCEKMHDYLPDQHDPVNEDHCGAVRPQFIYNNIVGKVEYEQNGMLQISKGHEDETTVDIDGTKTPGTWSGKKKNDIAKKRLMSHAFRIMMKRKRRRKILRRKARNGHRRTKIFKNQTHTASKTLKAPMSNQTAVKTKTKTAALKKHKIRHKNSGKKWTINSGDGQDHSNTFVDAPQQYNWGDTGNNFNDYDDANMGGDNHMETCRMKHSVEYCAWKANRELSPLRHDDDFGGHDWIGNYAKVHEHEPEHVHTETHTEYSSMNTPHSEVTIGELHHVSASIPEHHDIPDANVEVGEVHHLLTDSPEQHHHLEGTTVTPNEHINVDEVNKVESVERLPYLQHSLHHSNTGEYNHEGDVFPFHNDHGDTGSYTHEGDHFPDIGSDLHIGNHDEGNTVYPHHDYDYFGGDHHDGHYNDGEVGVSHDNYEHLREPKVETTEASHLETSPANPVTTHDHDHPNDDLSHVFVDTGVGTVPLADHPASVVADGSIEDDTERDEFAKRTGNITHFKRHQEVIVHPGRNSSLTVPSLTNSTLSTVSPDTKAVEMKTTTFLTSRRHVLASNKIHKHRQSEKRNLKSNSAGKTKT